MSCDLVDCNDITDSGIVNELRERFYHDIIYSTIGPIIVSINPYKSMELLYSKLIMDDYVNNRRQQIDHRLAHVWSAAYNAYCQMIQNRTPQTIIVTGESGSGKTEATKLSLQLFSSVATSRDLSNKGCVNKVSERILATNPILESFGNSKTSRNNNSSRFGKWLQIKLTNISETYNIVAASVSQYLLEKSRVIKQTAEERNYHIFYQLCAIKWSNLHHASSYKYLNYGPPSIEGVDDCSEMEDTINSFKNLGVSDDERTGIFSILKSILLLGNIEFESTNPDQTNQNIIQLKSAGMELATEVSNLLGFSKVDMLHNLTTRSMKVKDELVSIPFDENSAYDSINALSKEIYGRLFEYIVTIINNSLTNLSTSENKKLNEPDDQSTINPFTIGLLDIFGFEKFKYNSFEQLCINYANEKLQQYFIQFILKKEEILYNKEGIINMDKLNINDNMDILRLMEDRQFGIWNRLDDELKLPKGTDEGFIRKLENDLNSKNYSNFHFERRFQRNNKMSKTQFEIIHFAGIICYDANGFLEKNRDRLHEQLAKLLENSTNSMFKRMMGNETNSQNLIINQNDMKYVTIASRFQSQLQQLMKIIEQSEPHFIKCIKPNNKKMSDFFDHDLVLTQLRYSGILEAIKIRKHGYPSRKTYKNFLQLFWSISGIHRQDYIQYPYDKIKCQRVIEAIIEKYGDYFKEKIQIGKSLIFFRMNVLMELEKIRHHIQKKEILRIQTIFRKIIATKRVVCLLEGKKKLLDAISKGKQQNQCNTAAIPDLKEIINYCEIKLHMICYILQDAKTLLSRLEQLHQCFKRMKVFIDQPVSSEFSDIIQECYELKELLCTIDTFQVPSKPFLMKAKDRLNLLQHGATLLVAFQVAASLGDDVQLTAALQKMEQFVQVNKTYFSAELKNGAKLLQQIQKNNELLENIIECFEISHKQLLDHSLKLSNPDSRADQQKTGSSYLINVRMDTILPYLHGQFEKLEKSIMPLISNLSKNITTFDGASSLISPIPITAIEIFQNITKIHSLWKLKDWEELHRTVQQTLALGNNLLPQNQKFTTSCRLIDQINDIIGFEVDLVFREIITNVLLPKLLREMENYKAIVLGSDEVSFVNNDELEEEVSILKRTFAVQIDISASNETNPKQKENPHFIRTNTTYLKFSDTLKPVLLALELLLELRKSCIGKRWEEVILLAGDIILITPGSFNNTNKPDLNFSQFPEQTQLIAKRMISLVKSLNTVKVDFLDESSVNLQLTQKLKHSLTLINLLQQQDFSKLFPEINDFVFKIIDQILMLESYCKEQYIINLLQQSISDASKEKHEDVKNDLQEMEYKVNQESSLPLNSERIDLVLNEINQLYNNMPTLSSSTNLLIEMIKELKYFRISHLRGETKSLIERFLKNSELIKKILNSYDNDVIQMPQQSMECVNQIRIEILTILNHAVNQQANIITKEAIKIGGLVGEIGECKTENLRLDLLGNAISTLMDWRDKLISLGIHSTTEEYDILIDLLESLRTVRQQFISVFCDAETNGFESRNIQAINLKDLQYFKSYSKSLPFEFFEELDIMEKEVEYQMCIQAFKEALKVEMPTQYTIQNARTRRKSISMLGSPAANNSPLSISKTKSVSFDKAASLDECTLDEMLIEEDLLLNDLALDTSTLRSAIAQGDEFAARTHNLQLPKLFQDFKLTCDLIKSLRESVSQCSWMKTLKIFISIRERKLTQTIPLINNEILACEEFIQSYVVIFVCKQALMENIPIGGTVGQIDYSTITLELQEETIQLCQSVGCKTKKAKEIFAALLLISDLRKSQKNGDIQRVKAILARIDKEGIGMGNTALCISEINRAIVEKDNTEAVESLKLALVQEVLFSHDSIINFKTVSVNKLSNAINLCQSIPEDSQGQILRSLLNFAINTNKVRKAAVQEQTANLKQFLEFYMDNVENFQTDLERIDKNNQPKTVLTRSSTIRGTILGNSKEKGLTPMKSDSFEMTDTRNAKNSSKPSCIELFSALVQNAQMEIRCIEQHFAAVELESNLLEALQSHQISMQNFVSGSKSEVKIEMLNKQLKIKSEMEIEGFSLPLNILNLSKAAKFILDIRVAFLSDKWEELNSLVNNNLHDLYGIMPETSRLEINAIRQEVENRWIISTLTKALQNGKLEGDIEQVQENLLNVSCEHLLSCISSMKSMSTSKSPATMLLLHTTDRMYSIRKLICNRSYSNSDGQQSRIDWESVSKLAKKIMKEIADQKVHEAVLPEVKLITQTAEETILCNVMAAAIKTGNIAGESGLLDATLISVKELDSACKLANGQSLKSKYTQYLFKICRLMFSVRSALIEIFAFNENQQLINDQDRKTSKNSSRKIIAFTPIESDYWKVVRTDIAELKVLLNTQSVRDFTWKRCNDEMELLSEHAAIQGIHSALYDSTVQCSIIYSNRNDHQYFSSDGKLLDDGHSKEKYILPLQDLDSIIEQSKSLQINSKLYMRYVQCANTLRTVRNLINNANWESLEKKVMDTEVKTQLTVFIEAEKEFAWVMCELHNRKVIQLISQALLLKESNAIMDGNKVKKMETISHTLDNEESNKVLENALIQVRKYRVTAKAAKQLMECCSAVLQLRQGLERQDNNRVEKSLQWFKTNINLCPEHIQLEAQRAQGLYQNGLLLKEITLALERGKPTGPVGEINRRKIELNEIEILLANARELQPKSTAVQDLIEAAEVAYSIRKSLKMNDTLSLQNIVHTLTSQESFNLLIVDEIAVARAEVDNEIVVKTCITALKSFDDSESKALDFSFTNHNQTSIDSNGAKPSIPTRNQSILRTFGINNERRYSFANQHHNDIDPNTIDLASLESALRIVNDLGAYSEQARRLKRTVELILNLRQSMKIGDWLRVEEIINVQNFKVNINSGIYDEVAKKEIFAVQSQLELRRAILDLSKALKSDWAKCSNGIVDTSSMNIVVLMNAIERAELSVNGLIGKVQNRNDMSLTDNNYDDENQVDNRGGTSFDTIEPLMIDQVVRRGSSHLSRLDSIREEKTEMEDDEMIHRKESEEQQHDESNNTQDDLLSPVQKQMKSLLLSAKLVYKVRELLVLRNIPQAGRVAESALKRLDLHYSVVDELKLYCREINAALFLFEMFDLLKRNLADGQLVGLGMAISRCYENGIHHCNDLGLIQILQVAKKRYEEWMLKKKELLTLRNSWDEKKINLTMKDAVGIGLVDPSLELLKSRLYKLQLLQIFVKGSSIISGGLYTHRMILNHFIETAKQLELSDHPMVYQAKRRLQLSNQSFFCNSVAESIHNAFLNKRDSNASKLLIENFSCDDGSIMPWIQYLSNNKGQTDAFYYHSTRQSMEIRRQYLLQPTMKELYQLENYHNLRHPDDFGIRMNIVSKDLKENVLFHSNQPLPTSLTNLSTTVASISIWIFLHGIYGIERNHYSVPEVMIKKVIELGRQYVLLRDEILLQVVKQLRRNEDLESSKRLWHLLCCCLYHFPPSKSLESYLELFLINASISSDPVPSSPTPLSSTKSSFFSNSARLTRTRSNNRYNDPPIPVPQLPETHPIHTVYATRAIYCLHLSVWKYGYDQKLSSVPSPTDNFKDWIATGGEGALIFQSPCQLSMIQSSLSLNISSEELSAPLESAFQLTKQNMIHSTEKMLNDAQVTITRGSNGDWKNRYQHWLQSKTSDELETGAEIRMNRNTFSETLGISILDGTIEIDDVDREILYHFLFGKDISGLRFRIQREFISDYHINAKQDHIHLEKKTIRCHLIQKNIYLFLNTVERSQFTSSTLSTLRIAQILPIDVKQFACTFWDMVIVPIMDVGQKATGDKSITHDDEICLNEECYHDLIVTAMRCWLQMNLK